MLTTHSTDELRHAVRGWRAQGQRIGLVPTMGNLHVGHYSLLDTARRHADRIVATVFVNPTQFGPNEDFSRYPRTLDDDRLGLQAKGCDLLFAPAVETMYPFGPADTARVEVPAVTEPLEGAVRPGHFVGVATVVSKLFNLVQPDVAVFGQKDFQQLLTIRRLVADLGFPIDIVTAPTQREANGLAMSSRNQYLQGDERQRAAAIYRELQNVGSAIRTGVPPALAAQAARDNLEAENFKVDYVSVRRASDLSEPNEGDLFGLVALVAARLGSTRLIDNLLLDS
jgi:pantoate--beta-alanine ligase